MEIRHQCPRCGGPVVLQETDRLLTCGFCKTKLFIEPSDYLRYCFPASDPFLEDIIYVPYWRFRGMHFLCKTSGISDGIIDKTFCAVNTKGFPHTMGIRPQTLQLNFAKPAEHTLFVRPETAFTMSSVETKNAVSYEIVRSFETRIVDVGGDDYRIVPETRLVLKEEHIHHEAFLADTASLVYTPCYLKEDRVYDAITNEIIKTDPADLLRATEPLSDWRVDFLPTICPNCGWDTVAEKDSCVVFCSNCDSAWETSSTGMNRVACTVSTLTANPGASGTYLPFWRIDVDVQGLDLASYGDLARFANLPKVIRPEWEEEPFHVWVPAFKTIPSVFLRLAKQLTVANPGAQRETSLHSPLCPVTMPREDAAQLIKTVIADLALKKKDLFPRLRNIDIAIRNTLLVFIPFTITDHEYVQEEIKCGFQKTALERGRKI